MGGYKNCIETLLADPVISLFKINKNVKEKIGKQAC